MVHVARAVLVLSLLSVSGCPDTTPVTRGRCEGVGTPCQLENGTLGICSESLATACPSPPCLACTPQH